MILNLIFIGLIFFLNNQLVDADNDADWKLVRKTWYQGLPYGYIYKTSIDKDDLWNYVGKKLENDIIPTPRGQKLTEVGVFFERFYKPNNFRYIMYNDETPYNIEGFTLPDSKKIQKYGQGRGVLVWDDKQVVWTLHSIERYPLPFNNGIYKFTRDTIFGQSILFINLKFNDLKTIIKHLIIMEARVYDMKLGDDDIKLIQDAQNELNNEMDLPYQDLTPRTSYRRGSVTSLMSSDSKYSSTSHSVRTNSDSKIKDHFVSNLKASLGTNVRIITKTSKISDELWSRVQNSFQEKLYIKSIRRSRDYPRFLRRPKCKNSNFVEILRFKIDYSSIHDYRSTRSGVWSYDEDKSRFAICDSKFPKSNCFCMSNSNKKKVTKTQSDKADMAVCLFDDRGSNMVKNLNSAIKKSILTKSCRE